MQLVKELENWDYSKIFTTLNEWKLYKEQALIRSHGIDITKREIELWFRAFFNSRSDFSIRIMPNNQIHIYIYDVTQINKNLLSGFNTKFNLMGWYNSDIYLFDNDDNEIYDKHISFSNLINNIQDYISVNNLSYVGLVLESNFDNKLENNYQSLFHVTKKEHLDSILKLGLSPRSNNRLSVHPDRVYLAFNKQILINDTIKFQDSDNKEHIKYINHLNGKEQKYFPDFTYVLLEIKDKNIKLYQDPNYKNGCFTLENINPENITYLQDIEYKPKV